MNQEESKTDDLGVLLLVSMKYLPGVLIPENQIRPIFRFQENKATISALENLGNH